MATTFPGVPDFVTTNLSDWIRKARITINGCLNGRTNNTGTFTLAANTVSTNVVIAEGRLGPDTVVVFVPTTSTAATAFGSGGMWQSSRSELTNTFSFTHPNTADSDKIFQYVLVG